MKINLGLRMSVGFIAWCSIIALRAIYTHPYELLWFVGNVMSGAAAVTVGVMWAQRATLTRAARRRDEGD